MKACAKSFGIYEVFFGVIGCLVFANDPFVFLKLEMLVVCVVYNNSDEIIFWGQIGTRFAESFLKIQTIICKYSKNSIIYHLLRWSG